VTGAAGLLGEPIRIVVDRYTLWVFNVGLACCAVEFVAASVREHGFGEAGTGPGAERIDVLVVSGTVTDRMAPAIKRLYEQLPGPTRVISFGACANTGGPYWDSYVVTKGVDQLIPVDVYVPGCPPRPEALRQGMLRLGARVARPAPVPAALTAGPVRPPTAAGASR
jgi:NADH-quinone oxidoreductase subunit B